MGFPILVRRHLCIESRPITANWKAKEGFSCEPSSMLLWILLAVCRHNWGLAKGEIVKFYDGVGLPTDRLGDRILLNPMYQCRGHISLAQFNSLWPSDAKWRQKSGSTLAQVMSCCLTAPSHYLNQCWLIISKVQWHSSEGNFTRDTSAISHWN